MHSVAAALFSPAVEAAAADAGQGIAIGTPPRVADDAPPRSSGHPLPARPIPFPRG